ncbi:unnamed protein product [Laminaria digitata]
MSVYLWRYLEGKACNAGEYHFTGTADSFSRVKRDLTQAVHPRKRNLRSSPQTELVNSSVLRVPNFRGKTLSAPKVDFYLDLVSEMDIFEIEESATVWEVRVSRSFLPKLLASFDAIVAGDGDYSIEVDSSSRVSLWLWWMIKK